MSKALASDDIIHRHLPVPTSAPSYTTLKVTSHFCSNVHVCWCERLADGWGTTATTRVPRLWMGERPREWTKG